MSTNEKRMMEIEDATYDNISTLWIEEHKGVTQTRDEADKDYHTNFNRLFEAALAANSEYQELKGA